LHPGRPATLKYIPEFEGVYINALKLNEGAADFINQE